MTYRTGTALAAALLAISALPAAAQEAACGPSVPPGTWVGGAAATSDIATGGAPFDQLGEVPPAGYWVSNFTLSAEAAVRVEAQGRYGADPVIELYDATGTLVLTDDDSGGNLNPALVFADPMAGQYDIWIGSYSASENIAGQLLITELSEVMP